MVRAIVLHAIGHWFKSSIAHKPGVEMFEWLEHVQSLYIKLYKYICDGSADKRYFEKLAQLVELLY